MSDKNHNPENKGSAAGGIQGGGIQVPDFVKSSKVFVLSAKERPDVTYRLHKDRVVIGTVSSADVRLSGHGISPIHAVIEVSGAGQFPGALAVIFDLASDTGVFVNGQKVVTHGLKSGDQIVIGNQTLIFDSEAPKFSSGKTLYVDQKADVSALLLETPEGGALEIFDYRETSKTALEVVLSWRSTILDIEHFVDYKEVKIGPSRDCDFGIPALLQEKEFAFVTPQSATSASVRLDPKMGGVVHKQGKLISLNDYRVTYAGGAGATTLPLEAGDFAKIKLGELDFYLSFTPAPPKLKRQNILERDPFFLKIFISSLAGTAALIGAMSLIEVPKQVEVEQVSDRIATILYQPEKFEFQPKPEEPKPQEPKVETPPKPKPQETIKVKIEPKADPVKEIPKQMNVAKEKAKAEVKQNAKASTKNETKAANQRAQNEAKEGEGARAKGAEGTRGKPNAKADAEPQNKAQRPSAQSGSGMGGGKSQVPSVGNVDMLKGASEQIQNLLGSGANALGKGGSKVQGFGGFDTKGGGGLALSGEGKGGGGSADLLGGLGNKGLGGGRVGTGLGAAGNGSGIVGGRSRVVLQRGGSEETVVTGAIDRGAIDAAIRAHADEFRLCYEKELNPAGTTDLAGTVTTNFVIGSSGRVTQAGVERSSLGNTNAEQCILKVLRRIPFPEPVGGGVVQVIYPFKFSATPK